MQQTSTNVTSTRDQLIELIQPLLTPLGYEIVHLEVILQRTKTLRVFVDRVDGTAVGIEDCVKVTRALDEPLDQIPEVEAVFKGPYELEVSSPGVDRPLRQAKDYEKFSGQEVRIHVFRPLTAEEIGNAGYQQKNPKQKNFLGTLKGLREDRVLLAINASGSSDGGKGKPGKKAKAPKNAPAAEEILIPLPLISKANLEPKFEVGERENERH